MKVFTVDIGHKGGPWYFDLRPEPSFHVITLVDAKMTITLESGATIELTTANGGAILLPPMRAKFVLSAAQSAQLKRRHDHPYVTEFIDTEGEPWIPRDDGRGVIKPN